MKDTIFHSQTKGLISLDEVIKEIVLFIKKEPQCYYKVIIGTDSEACDCTVFVTAVIVWRVGNGAIHFWTKSEPCRFSSFRDRIWQEAMNSITLAQEVRTRLKTVLGDDFFWDGNEIHVDIGREGKTKELIDGVVGMIKGYNFEPVIKPEAFGASIVADKHI